MLHRFSPPERRRLLLSCGVALLLLAAWILFAPHGAVRYYRLHQEIETLKAENARLAESNRAMTEEIARLKNDPAYLEEFARREYGLLRKNEILFDFSSPKGKH